MARWPAALLLLFPALAFARWEGPFVLSDGGRSELLAPVRERVSITWEQGAIVPDRLQAGAWTLLREGPLSAPRWATHAWRIESGPPLVLQTLHDAVRVAAPRAVLVAPLLQLQGGGPARAVLPRVLLQLRAPGDGPSVLAHARRIGLGEGVPFGASPGQLAFQVPADAPPDPLAAADALAADAGVRWAQPDWIVPKATRYVPGDSFFPAQWHLDNEGQDGGIPGEDIGAVAAWDLTLGDEAAIIAVLDSGVDLDHPDLAEQLLPGWDVLDDDAGAEPDGLGSHGTSVAGVAAAPAQGVGVVGVCPRCRVVPVRMLGAPDSGEAEAIDFAVEAGAWVINNSWGPIDGTGAWTPMPNVVEAAVLNAVTNGRDGLGTVIVWAAGNGSPIDTCSDDGYARHPSVIAVGASTNLGQHATYSEECPELDVVAPSAGGTAALTTTRIGDYTSSFGGTSGAAPVVAGAVGLLLSAQPTLGPEHVQEILQSTATKLDNGDAGYDAAGHSDRYGYGRIDLWEALHGDLTWIQLDAPVSRCETDVAVTVTAPDLAGSGELLLWASSTVEPDAEDIPATEGPAGVWQAIVHFTAAAPVHGDGMVSVAHGGSASVGSVALAADRPVLFDCLGPEFSAAVVDQVTTETARVRWTTSERSTSSMSWEGGDGADDVVGTDHELYATGLDACTSYTVTLAGVDALGNESIAVAAATFVTRGDPDLIPDDAPDDADPCDPSTWEAGGDDDTATEPTPDPPGELRGTGCACEDGAAAGWPVVVALPYLRRRARARA